MTNTQASGLHRDPADQNAVVPPIQDGMEGELVVNEPSTDDQSVAKPLLAYAVLETDENTGGIVFARHAITARRIGADQYADGEFSYVSCRRAKWADRYGDTGIVPASVMVWHGWHFECSYCGSKIDGGDDFWPHKKWTPDFVIGNGNGGMVFCDRSCCTAHQRQQDFAERLKVRTVAHYAKRLEKRLPGITVLPIDKAYTGSHVYIDRGRIRQFVISFDWPGQQISSASFRWDGPGKGKPHITCCNGDRKAFETFAADSQKAPA